MRMRTPMPSYLYMSRKMKGRKREERRVRVRETTLHVLTFPVPRK